ncbi:hypothetical protein WS86_12310 [Burkholderia savannae]|nr:hypothetical protein WS86_12310 [Burkholderia savannae]
MARRSFAKLEDRSSTLLGAALAIGVIEQVPGVQVRRNGVACRVVSGWREGRSRNLKAGRARYSALRSRSA